MELLCEKFLKPELNLISIFENWVECDFVCLYWMAGILSPRINFKFLDCRDFFFFKCSYCKCGSQNLITNSHVKKMRFPPFIFIAFAVPSIHIFKYILRYICCFIHQYFLFQSPFSLEVSLSYSFLYAGLQSKLLPS